MNMNAYIRTDVTALRRAIARSTRNRVTKQRAIEGEVAELRAEVEQLTLVLTALVAQLDSCGTVPRHTLVGLMNEADGIDGHEDGRLPVAALRELLLGEAEDDSTSGGPPGTSAALGSMPSEPGAGG